MTPPEKAAEVDPQDLMQESTVDDYEVPQSEPANIIHRYNAFAAQHESIVAKSLFSAGFTWPGVVLAEDRHALDYLASRPDIDEERLGCCGLSGGGLRTNYLAGVDDRIGCSVTVGFMTTWRDFAVNVSYTHTWMIYIPMLPLHMEYPEILTMRAPLPSLVLATEGDPLFTLDEMRRSREIMKQVYRKAKAPDAFTMSIYEGPHKFDLPMQREAFNWFDQWLHG